VPGPAQALFSRKFPEPPAGGKDEGDRLEEFFAAPCFVLLFCVWQSAGDNGRGAICGSAAAGHQQYRDEAGAVTGMANILPARSRIQGGRSQEPRECCVVASGAMTRNSFVVQGGTSTGRKAVFQPMVFEWYCSISRD